MFLLLFFFLIISTLAKETAQTPIIYIHEELPADTLLYSPSSSSSHIFQWLPSSYPYQPYFFLSANQSLYTTTQSIDREEFCEKKLCNCSQCQINLNFLQTFSMNNISIQTIQVIIEGEEDQSPSLFEVYSLSLSLQTSTIIPRHSNNRFSDFRSPKMSQSITKFLWKQRSIMTMDYSLYKIMNCIHCTIIHFE